MGRPTYTFQTHPRGLVYWMASAEDKPVLCDLTEMISVKLMDASGKEVEGRRESTLSGERGEVLTMVNCKLNSGSRDVATRTLLLDGTMRTEIRAANHERVRTMIHRRRMVTAGSTASDATTSGGSRSGAIDEDEPVRQQL